ncbi:TetR family transcriptional regulator [Afipia sp. Root123D2]|uniref:TetR/AcrR family transcriptional regulator n=1 Tax=Afipia sp. Root123D2 TaxID=1736436 RepID=UPI0006F3CE6B|nr:TetR/AcrR family transcriptional regulator [Afipia sp. Root123D2]KQW21183.1 TetR family transcriptional regulator [Afipia sp. Root123D2]
MVQKRTRAPKSGVKSAPAKVATTASMSPEATATKRRGRPRAFESEVALGRALDTFRDSGFAATSLDDLSAAMGINRPSLYGAFGDKRELFLKAYERYRAEAGVLFAKAFDPALSLRVTLERVYAIAIDFYAAGENGPRGCLTVMTAASEAMADPEIRQIAQNAIAGADRNLTRRIQKAIEDGELPKSANAVALGQVASAMFHTLAIRARAGVPRAELEALVRGTIDLIAGPAKPRR